MELEEMLNRLKNPSTRLCGSGESAENLKDSDVCPLCGGDEWVSYLDEKGIDVRNYGQLAGIPEARELFADMLGVLPKEVIFAFTNDRPFLTRLKIGFSTISPRKITSSPSFNVSQSITASLSK